MSSAIPSLANKVTACMGRLPDRSDPLETDAPETDGLETDGLETDGLETDALL